MRKDRYILIIWFIIIMFLSVKSMFELTDVYVDAKSNDTVLKLSGSAVECLYYKVDEGYFVTFTDNLGSVIVTNREYTYGDKDMYMDGTVYSVLPSDGWFRFCFVMKEYISRFWAIIVMYLAGVIWFAIMEKQGVCVDGLYNCIVCSGLLFLVFLSCGMFLFDCTVPYAVINIVMLLYLFIVCGSNSDTIDIRVEVTD